MMLFLLAAFSGDIGGPLIWPMLAIVLGVFGTITGFAYRIAKRMRS